ncbi:type II secretion system protein [Schinkia sp. CFF1]
MLNKYLKNSKGLTLLELLAVVVILGTISVISVLAIANIIANTKKDAHIANAILIVNEAKKYVMSEHIHIDDHAGLTISLKTLIDEGYLNPIKDPHSDGYYDEYLTDVIISIDGDKYVYKVALIGPNNSFTYTNHAKEVFLLTRDDIHTP